MEALARRAIEVAPGDPWARLALAEGAQRSLDREGEIGALAELIERAPRHPLAAVAASRLAAMTRISTVLDAAIESRVERLLARGDLDPEAAARLRAALRFVRAGRGIAVAGGVIADSGALTEAAVVGPFSPWHHLDARTAYPPELGQPVQAIYGEDGVEERRRCEPGVGENEESGASTGGSLPPCAGSIHSRPLRHFSLPDGWLSLGPEERAGDVYYALSRAEVPANGRYELRLATAHSTSAAVFMDGLELLRREAHGAAQPSVVVGELEIPAGRHLVALRLLKGGGSGGAALFLTPKDGAASPVIWRAAQEGDGPGTPPRLVGAPSFRSARGMASALEPEAGILAAYVAARDARHADPEGAKGILDGALALLPRSAPLLSLRADATRGDQGLPSTIAQARAAADLEAVLSVDPANPRALWSAATVLRDAGRHEDALEKIDAAQAASKVSSTLELARARVTIAQGFETRAMQYAKEALRLDPGSCAAGGIVFDLARRADSAAEADGAATTFAACASGRARLANLLADRGKVEEALGLARELAAEDPQDPSAGLRLADRHLAAGDPAAAAAVVAGLEASWPRSAYLVKRRSQLLERAGDERGALEARALALRLDGSDLALRRMDAFVAGEDVLARYDRDGLEVIREFESKARSFDTPSVILHDFAGVEIYADGSFIERTHLVAKILDKRGIDQLGEVHIPGGAEVIRLRTIKQDGRILEPEEIAGKDSISLPNLEVGDYVETEYLNPSPARGNGLDGWSAASFYFRSEGTPLLDSIYVVRAQRGAGLELDLHNGAPEAEVIEEGEFTTLRMRSRNNPTFLQEPTSVRTEEILPWVQAGSGADEAKLAAFFGDSLAASADRSFEVSAWARAVAATVRKGDQQALVRAIYEKAMEEIEGSDGSFGARASQILARKRGNRLVLIKAALDELGIESRFAAVRTFDQAPGAFRFPRPARWAYLALVVRPDPAGGQVWLDPSMRWAPFGEVSPIAQGSPAWLLPGPGQEMSRTSTPFDSEAPRGREVEVQLSLSDDGSLAGVGSERYLGFDAAWARGSLEPLDDERRKQVIEAALAKSFRGLVLEDLEVELEQASGSPLTLRYRFSVPEATHEIGQGLHTLDLDFFAANLGRRFLTRGDRETTLLLRAPEKVETRVTIELPPTLEPVGIPDAARELSPHGSYKRMAASSPGKVAIEESLAIERGRVTPRDYRAFAEWVWAVDRAQGAELVLVRTAKLPIDGDEAPPLRIEVPESSVTPSP